MHNKAGRELPEAVPEGGEEEKPRTSDSEDVQRAATAAGHVLLRALPEAARGEGLPLCLVSQGSVRLRQNSIRCLHFFSFLSAELTPAVLLNPYVCVAASSRRCAASAATRPASAASTASAAAATSRG